MNAVNTSSSDSNHETSSADEMESEVEEVEEAAEEEQDVRQEEDDEEDEVQEPDRLDHPNALRSTTTIATKARTVNPGQLSSASPFMTAAKPAKSYKSFVKFDVEAIRRGILEGGASSKAKDSSSSMFFSKYLNSKCLYDFQIPF
jgi:predicted phage gp36 major capsid-like protein